MDRAPLHGAPGLLPHLRKRRTAPAFDSQDARSNLAIQPAANAGAVVSIKLKKPAVKIVRAAAPPAPPSTPSRSAASTPLAATPSSLALSSVKAEAKEPERYVNLHRIVFPKTHVVNYM